ncbi:nucleotidyltransferase family protein [Nitrospirillum iridis]|uniref:Nucleotidyltransferase family protein n=1 Tax=Nitrospirillum iridis TaxID=765888 RepID=A0A7X0B0W2_9PROT|nr:nucleotidyltransferase family protein [Nitrospirillum iridis]MBB6253703.1 hypothetical protein [Nitrospirillum iridis]
MREALAVAGDGANGTATARLVFALASPLAQVPPPANGDAAIDWGRLVAMVRSHGIPGLAGRPAARRLLTGLAAPDAVLRDLSGGARASALGGLKLTQHTVRAYQTLEAAGVAARVVKGAMESLISYGDAALRTYSDIDILVAPDQAPAAAAALADAGYTPEAPKALRFAGRPDVALSQLRFSAAPEADGKRGVLVELHWRPTDRAVLFPLPMDHVMARPAQISLGGAAVATLSPALRILHLSSHAASHGWTKLKWVADIAHALHADPAAAEEALDLARRWRVVGVYGASCHLATALLGVPAPRGLPAPGRREAAVLAHTLPRLVRPLVGAERRGWRPPLRQLREEMGLLDHLPAKLQLLRYYLRPRTEDIEAGAGDASLLRITLARLGRLALRGPRRPEAGNLPPPAITPPG